MTCAHTSVCWHGEDGQIDNYLLTVWVMLALGQAQLTQEPCMLCPLFPELCQCLDYRLDSSNYGMLNPKHGQADIPELHRSSL